MLATRWPEPFVDPAWGFEVKWDGVRIILGVDEGGVRLRSRAGNDATAKYPELGTADFGRPVILDGEVVAFDETGRPSFERLQQRMNVTAPSQVAELQTRVPIEFVVFDVLFDREPLLDLPWRERRARLAGLELPAPMVRSEPIDGDPSALWDVVVARNIEGIVGKRLDSVYVPGVRSADWRKVAAVRTVRALVGGFTVGEGGRTGTFGSLALGLATDGGLRYIGAVGSGFSDADLRAIRAALDRMTTPAPPFVSTADVPKGTTWVEPHLVAMVEFKEWTGVARLRAPVFKGFTDDAPSAVTWDAEGPAAG